MVNSIKRKNVKYILIGEKYFSLINIMWNKIKGVAMKEKNLGCIIYEAGLDAIVNKRNKPFMMTSDR